MGTPGTSVRGEPLLPSARLTFLATGRRIHRGVRTRSRKNRAESQGMIAIRYSRGCCDLSLTMYLV